MEKQYSVQFFTSLVESIQKCCREFLEFDQAIELSGYLNLEIDNFKKERYVLSEMITSMGDVISESYCTKAFKTVQRNPRKSPTIESVLKESSNNFDRNIPSPPSQDISSHIGIRRRFGPQRHYLSPPGRKRNLIQNKRVIPSSFTQASLTKNAQPYEIQARPTMTMTYSTTEESVLSTSEHFSALGNESLVSNYVKDDVTDSDQIKEKTANDLDVLYAAATSVSNLENSEFTPVSNISTNVVQTNAQSSNNSCITESEGSHSETIRLPLSIKEEDNDEDDDIMFIDGPDNGTGNVTVTSCSALNTSGANVESHLNTSFSDGQRREGEENSGSIELKHDSVGVLQVVNYRRRQEREMRIMKRRMVSQSGKRMYFCDSCNYQTIYQHAMKRHKRIHTGDFFHCHLCRCHFSDKHRLMKHLKVHINTPTCRFCGKKYSTDESLKRHEKNHEAMMSRT